MRANTWRGLAGKAKGRRLSLRPFAFVRAVRFLPALISQGDTGSVLRLPCLFTKQNERS
jgi:hypothetical protein